MLDIRGDCCVYWLNNGGGRCLLVDLNGVKKVVLTPRQVLNRRQLECHGSANLRNSAPEFVVRRAISMR